MIYAILRDGEPVELSLSPFVDNAGISHPANVLTLWTQAELAAIDVLPVVDDEVPLNAVITGSTLERDGDLVRRRWQATPEPEANVAGRVRADRNARLAACDWTQLADAPVDSLAWANYRQALRDAPNQEGFPWSVEWPTQPA
jgi:hypothetical protein